MRRSLLILPCAALLLLTFAATAHAAGEPVPADGIESGSSAAIVEAPLLEAVPQAPDEVLGCPLEDLDTPSDPPDLTNCTVSSCTEACAADGFEYLGHDGTGRTCFCLCCTS